MFVLFLFAGQGYNKEKIPKGKSGPQPDLKIKKVCIVEILPFTAVGVVMVTFMIAFC